MTVYVVCAFRGGPVAVFLSFEKAHAYVMQQPGKFNNFEIEEMEVQS
jgi:hypothetical protein